jgi:hypothetical protein
MELNVTAKKKLTVERQTILARVSSDNNGGVITFQLHTADVVTIGAETLQSAWTPHEITLTDEVYAIVCHRSGMTPEELARKKTSGDQFVESVFKRKVIRII